MKAPRTHQSTELQSPGRHETTRGRTKLDERTQENLQTHSTPHTSSYPRRTPPSRSSQLLALAEDLKILVDGSTTSFFLVVPTTCAFALGAVAVFFAERGGERGSG